MLPTIVPRNPPIHRIHMNVVAWINDMIRNEFKNEAMTPAATMINPITNTIPFPI